MRRRRPGHGAQAMRPRATWAGHRRPGAPAMRRHARPRHTLTGSAQPTHGWCRADGELTHPHEQHQRLPLGWDPHRRQPVRVLVVDDEANPPNCSRWPCATGLGGPGRHWAPGGAGRQGSSARRGRARHDAPGLRRSGGDAPDARDNSTVPVLFLTAKGCREGPRRRPHRRWRRLRDPPFSLEEVVARLRAPSCAAPSSSPMRPAACWPSVT